MKIYHVYSNESEYFNFLILARNMSDAVELGRIQVLLWNDSEGDSIQLFGVSELEYPVYLGDDDRGIVNSGSTQSRTVSV